MTAFIGSEWVQLVGRLVWPSNWPMKFLYRNFHRNIRNDPFPNRFKVQGRSRTNADRMGQGPIGTSSPGNDR